MEIFDIRMADGSRHFADLPQSSLWFAVRDHVMALSEAELTGFVSDLVAETWIEFNYRGHEFSINNQMGEYWFFVEDPTCPDCVLRAIIEHFGALLRG